MRSPLVAPLLCLLLAGCVAPGRRAPCGRPCPVVPTPSVAPLPDRALYDGEGTKIRLAAFLAEADDADLVVFGELHGDAVGATYERLVLESLSSYRRPLALAMEFFERDQQDALDRHLAGELDEEAFKKATRRTPSYDATHGPLVEWAKANDIPVVAANAPRRLVTGYRKSKAGSYDEYRASLTEEERGWLPLETTIVEDAYWEAFRELMGPHAPAFFKSQALWDDAMAESMARFRDAHPEHRILFVVGAFHVTGRLGTITKYLRRRPDDRVALLVMSRDEELAFDEADEGSADAVLKVRPPPRRPRGPNPHARPAPRP